MRTLQPLEPRELTDLTCPWCGRTPPRATFGLKVVRDRAVVGALAIGTPRREMDWCPPASVMLTQLWVRPEDVGEHVGTQLVQRLLATQKARGVRCLVAYGTRGRSDCEHLPGDFLDALGFVEHVEGVQWRIDLSRTAPALIRLQGALDAVRQWAPGGNRPAPASRN